MTNLAMLVAILSIAILGTLVARADTAVAQMTIVSDQVQFENVAGAAVVPIPDSATAFPGTSCGDPLTGIGTSVQIFFDSNGLVVTNPVTNSLCIFDNGAVITPPGNTNPNVMIANTIVGNGEDDFLIVFDHPVLAVGFGLLTNFSAVEIVTLKDDMGNTISVENIDGLTAPNTRQFVGFISTTPIKSVLIDTLNGAVQNEGIEAIKVAQVTGPLLLLRPDVFAVAVEPEQEPEEPVEQFLKAIIEPPVGVSATDIDPNTVTLSLNSTVLATAESPVIVGSVLEVLFPLNLTNVSAILGLDVTEVEVDELSGQIKVNATSTPSQPIVLIELSVSGDLTGGGTFSGTAVLVVEA